MRFHRSLLGVVNENERLRSPQAKPTTTQEGVEDPPELPPRARGDTPVLRLSSNSNFELCTSRSDIEQSKWQIFSLSPYFDFMKVRFLVKWLGLNSWVVLTVGMVSGKDSFIWYPSDIFCFKHHTEGFYMGCVPAKNYRNFWKLLAFWNLYWRFYCLGLP